MAFALVDLNTAIDAASVRPARRLIPRQQTDDVDSKPQGLVVGAPADLVLFDLAPMPPPAARTASKLTVRQTVIAGESAWREEKMAT
jgi:hypothetical protein